MPRSPRSLECECCFKPVTIASRGRYMAMVKAGLKPLCNQCRRYIRPASAGVAVGSAGSARGPEGVAAPTLTTLGLVAKRGHAGKRVRSLASKAITRQGVSGCEAGGRSG